MSLTSTNTIKMLFEHQCISNNNLKYDNNINVTIQVTLSHTARTSQVKFDAHNGHFAALSYFDTLSTFF